MNALVGRLRAAIVKGRNTLAQWPDEPAAFVFEMFAELGLLFLTVPYIGLFLRRVGPFLSIALEIIAPAMPFDIRSRNSFSTAPFSFYWNIFKYAAPLTIFFCYIMNALLTFQCGTLFGTDPTRLYFLYDGFNALLYLVICPIYMATSICLIIITALSWRQINALHVTQDISNGLTDSYFSSSTRVAGFVTASFLITGLYISSYITDLADPQKTRPLYWFFDTVTAGVRILNRDGYYYTLMNAFLLFITSMAAFCYIAISIELFRLGGHLNASALVVEGDNGGLEIIDDTEAHLIGTLADFAYSYVMAKILVLTYAINILIWQISPAGRVANMHSAIGALLIIALFFLVVPAAYLNRKWHWLRIEHAKGIASAGQKEATDLEFHNLRPKRYRRIGMALDGIAGVLLFFILKWQYEFTDMWDVLANYWNAFWR